MILVNPVKITDDTECFYLGPERPSIFMNQPNTITIFFVFTNIFHLCHMCHVRFLSKFAVWLCLGLDRTRRLQQVMLSLNQSLHRKSHQVSFQQRCKQIYLCYLLQSGASFLDQDIITFIWQNIYSLILITKFNFGTV